MNPETLKRLEDLKDLGIAETFINMIVCNLEIGRCTEQQVLEYCMQKENEANAGHYARPKYGFSKVSSRRSNNHIQFWYK